MPHSQGIEGVEYNSAASTHNIVTIFETEGYDGLHMIGSDGEDRIGFFAPYPLPFMHEAGLLPDDKHQKITRNGVYRLTDFEIPTLSTDAQTLLVEIVIDAQSYFLSYSPNMSERWMSFDPDGFETGIIVHLQQPETDRIAVLDFTPNSYRDGRVFSKADHDQQLFKDFRDGALQIGKTFTLIDQALRDTDITITPVSNGEENGEKYIDVQISGFPE